MKHLMFAVAVFLVVIGLVVLTSDKDETKILNAFAEQELSVPEWIEIDWKATFNNALTQKMNQVYKLPNYGKDTNDHIH